MKRGASAEQMILVLNIVVDIVNADMMWEYLEAIVDHPEFFPMATPTIALHHRKKTFLSQLIHIAKSKLRCPTFIIGPLFSALGHVITEFSGGKENIGLLSCIEFAKTKLNKPNFIHRSLFSALGQAIVQCSGGKEYVGGWLRYLPSSDRYILVPRLFDGILAKEEIERLNESILDHHTIYNSH